MLSKCVENHPGLRTLTVQMLQCFLQNTKQGEYTSNVADLNWHNVYSNHVSNSKSKTVKWLNSTGNSDIDCLQIHLLSRLSKAL